MIKREYVCSTALARAIVCCWRWNYCSMLLVFFHPSLPSMAMEFHEGSISSARDIHIFVREREREQEFQLMITIDGFALVSMPIAIDIMDLQLKIVFVPMPKCKRAVRVQPYPHAQCNSYKWTWWCTAHGAREPIKGISKWADYNDAEVGLSIRFVDDSVLFFVLCSNQNAFYSFAAHTYLLLHAALLHISSSTAIPLRLLNFHRNEATKIETIP